MVDRNGDGFIDASDLSQVGRMALQKTQVMSSRVPTPTDPYGLSSFHIISREECIYYNYNIIFISSWHQG